MPEKEQRTQRASSLGYTFLRSTTGLVFLFYGVGKMLTGVLKIAHDVQSEFAGTWLPPRAVFAFTAALPFLEVTAGILLVLGLYTAFGESLAGLLLAVLTTGKAIEGDSQTVAQNLVFAIDIFLLLRHIDQNDFSLDKLRWFREAKR